MSNNSQNDKQAFSDWPLEHLLFVSVRDGGDITQSAHSVANVHGITLEELKAQCRKAGDEWIIREGALSEINQPVYAWANGNILTNEQLYRAQVPADQRPAEGSTAEMMAIAKWVIDDADADSRQP